MLYGNNEIRCPDGLFLFYADNKKARWYIKSNLAEIIQQNPLILKLKFQPKGVGSRGDKYHEQCLVNRCVVCGSEQDLTKHHVVPYVYRKHLVKLCKDYRHDCHDILTACSTCHKKYEVCFSQQLHQKFLQEYGVTCEGVNVSFNTNWRIRSLATALLKYKIPENRKQEMVSIISEFLGHNPSTKDLKQLSNQPYKIKHENYKSAGHVIVDSLTTLEEIEGFIQRWRSHFVEKMKPKFLPNYWDVQRTSIRNLQHELHTNKCKEVEPHP